MRTTTSSRVGALVFAVLLVTSPVIAGVPVASGVSVQEGGDGDTGGYVPVSGETVNVTGSVTLPDGTNSTDDSVVAFHQGTNELVASDVTTTRSDGTYLLDVPPNGSYTVAFYQGDIPNGTAPMPRDGTPDVYALDSVRVETTDVDVSPVRLPVGHVVDVNVTDAAGDPVAGAQVSFVHRQPETEAETGWGNETDADGHVDPFGNGHGLELNGSVLVTVVPPDGDFDRAITNELSVTGDETLNVTLAPPAGGDLTVDDPIVAAHETGHFAVRNETGVGANDTYHWDFGDGTSADTVAPENETTHRYSRPGEYTARVFIGENGTDRLRFQDSVNVSVVPAGNADLAIAPETVTASGPLDATVTNVSLDITDSVGFYTWHTPGGETDRYPMGDNATVTYQHPGTYEIRVTAYNDTEAFLFEATGEVTVESGMPAVDGPWPTLAHDATRMSYNPNVSGPQSEPGELWSARFDDSTTGPAAIAGDVAYVATAGWNTDAQGDISRLYGLNVTDGSEVFNVSIGPQVRSSPTVAGGVAYVGTEDGLILGYRTADGSEVFNESIGAPAAVNAPAVVGDTVYATGHVGNESIVTAHWTNGTERTRFRFKDAPQARTPAVDSGTLFVPLNRSVVALHPSSGEAFSWSAPLAHDEVVASPPSVHDGRVFVTGVTAPDGTHTGTLNGTVYAFDAADGSNVWSKPIEAYVERRSYNVDSSFPNATATTVPAVVNGTVYVGADQLYSFDAATGATRGELDLTGRLSPGRSDALAATDVGTVYATVDYPTGTERSDDVVAVRNGDVLWRQDRVGYGFGHPSVADGTLVLVGERRVVALGGDVPNQPPNAYLGANRTDVEVGDPVRFDASDAFDQDGDVVEYRWDFDGDGFVDRTTTPPESDTTFSYGATGSYEARVTVVDDDGANDSATRTITVRGSGTLVAEPTVADVNVTAVTYSVENVTGDTPARYRWDLDGDGTNETRTDHPTVSVGHTYHRLLGETTARVVALDDTGSRLFDAMTTVDVVDRLPPAVRASAPASVENGETFTVDASGTTDNHRVANYTFSPDEGDATTTGSPTAAFSFSSSGNHSVTVTATDESGNRNSTTVDVFVEDVPDLTVDVTAPDTQRFSDGTTATVTVTNEGTDEATGVAVRLNASARSTYYRTERTSFDRTLGDLEPGEQTSVTVDFTDWAEGNISASRPRVDLTATVDPDDIVDERDESNNVAENATKVGDSDVWAYVYVPYDTIPSDSAQVRLRFYNRGGLASPEHEAVVDFGDGTRNETVTVQALESRESTTVTLDHAFPQGDHLVTVNVTDDPVDRRNVATDSTRTRPFDLSLSGPRASSEVERNETFYVTARARTNYPSNISSSITLPDGLELTDRYPRTRTDTDDDYVYLRWEVRAVETSGGTPHEIQVTTSARGETVAANDSVSVVVPKLRIRDSGSVALADDDSGTTTLAVRNETTFEHSLTVNAQLGPQGRTLAGLEYLFNYPNYCVEQTTSPMLAALNTDQYYRQNPAPGGYDRQKVNDSVAIGVERMTVGDNAQHDNGAWSMYGNDPEGDMYYTAYALFGTSSVAADPVQGSRPGVAADLDGADFNETVFWLEANQEDDGRLANDKFYFEDDAAMTGFGLVALDRGGPYNASATASAARIESNATAYLVGAQRADGSWGDGESNGMSTALAVWGLAVAGRDTPAVNAAIDDGVAWLRENQAADGAWTEDRSSSWRSTGTTSETTGYALLALNATGVPAEDDAISSGATYLVGTYDAEGSWGYTRASSVAIESLLALGVGGASPSQTVTVEFGTATDPALVTKTFEVDDAEPQDGESLTPAELETLRTAGSPITVTVDAAGTGQLVVAVENDQLVDADEYARNTGGD